ncbi:SDR family NAD(P)-dependent oxidoreductase [Candidatus Bathyarchaeota archaeon]|nr:MAG: SDR family NAD(P)-dependent oxidoreductase [Candidatus Bathyarchaeota archaeon]
MKSVALVTGAGRGLGRILATFLAGQGHDLVITSRTLTELQDVARSLESTGVKVVAIPGDITDAHTGPAYCNRRKRSEVSVCL